MRTGGYRSFASSHPHLPEQSPEPAATAANIRVHKRRAPKSSSSHVSSGVAPIHNSPYFVRQPHARRESPDEPTPRPARARCLRWAAPRLSRPNGVAMDKLTALCGSAEVVTQDRTDAYLRRCVTLRTLGEDGRHSGGSAAFLARTVPTRSPRCVEMPCWS